MDHHEARDAELQAVLAWLRQQIEDEQVRAAYDAEAANRENVFAWTLNALSRGDHRK